MNNITVFNITLALTALVGLSGILVTNVMSPVSALNHPALIRTNNSGGNPVTYQPIAGTPCWRQSSSQIVRPADLPFSACKATTTTTTVAPTTTLAPVTTTTTTTVPVTTTTVSPVTTTTVPSGYNVNDWLLPEAIPQDMSWEPSGNFRTQCNAGGTGTFDPIVSPGQNNTGHLHQFFGNTGVSSGSTYATLRNSGGSTCHGGPLNRTGYWVPALLDGSNQVQTPGFIILYYKAEGGGWDLAERQAAIRATQPFPAGLKMIAGYNMGTGQSDRFYWQCESSPADHYAQLPSSCSGNLIGVVEFPQCWDGTNLDSVDHRSHMAYKFYDNGKFVCPTSHPVAVPAITELIYYSSPGSLAGWKLSSDATAGTSGGGSYHADWFGAWDPAIMDRWLNACVRGMRNGVYSNLCDGSALRP